MDSPLFLSRITYILGVTNLFFLGLVFFSCRCLLGRKFTKKMLKYKWYQWVNKNHCYWWRFFFISVILHSLMAISAFGNPFVD